MVMVGGCGAQSCPRHDLHAVANGSMGTTRNGSGGMDVGYYNIPALPDDPFSNNYSSFPYLGELKHVPAWEAGIKIAGYAVIIVVALLGNLLVLVTVARTRRLHTTTNFYIVNLAVSDLLVTLMCTWVHLVDDLTEGWVLGAFFCKFNTFAQGKVHYVCPSCNIYYMCRCVLISIQKCVLN